MIDLTLPFPPSVNGYWRHNRGVTHISRRGRDFRDAVAEIISGLSIETILGPMLIELTLFPPDKRRRDVDNYQKGLLDALEVAGVYNDDSQIVRLTTEKRPAEKPGRAEVRIWS
jgi:crossover junction endodeoxyribonuclease RusA